MDPTDGRTCRTCGQPTHGAFCGSCGLPVDALKGLPPTPDRPGVGRSLRPVLVAGAAAGAAALLALGGIALLGNDSEPVPSAPTPAPGPASSSTATAVTASCERAGSRDGTGRATSYEPPRAIDSDSTTAWRCDGNGVGQSLTVTFAEPMRIERIGLIPGLAKTDPGDGTDRYAQNRRIASVRIATDDGRDVDARLDTSPGNRSAQMIHLTAPVVTRSITVSILDSDPGTTQNGQTAVDSVAIAELTWS